MSPFNAIIKEVTEPMTFAGKFELRWCRYEPYCTSFTRFSFSTAIWYFQSFATISSWKKYDIRIINNNKETDKDGDGGGKWKKNNVTKPHLKILISLCGFFQIYRKKNRFVWYRKFIKNYHKSATNGWNWYSIKNSCV